MFLVLSVLLVKRTCNLDVGKVLKLRQMEERFPSGGGSLVEVQITRAAEVKEEED